jgi:Bacterial Ig-like domain (group 3)/Right handed beta helix region
MLRALFIAACVAALPAFALDDQTWISGVGDDTNPCTRTAPCLTLAQALSQTTQHGEVTVLDPLALGSATITGSVTVVAVPLAGVSDAPTVTGLTINAPGARVTLRGLSFEANQSGVTGLRVVAVGALRLERCRFNGHTADAIDARVDGGLLFLDDVTVRGSLGAGLALSGARAVLNHSSFTHNGVGLAVSNGAKLTAHDVLLTDNGDAGVFAQSGADVNVEAGQLSRNGRGVEALGAVVRLSNANVTDNRDVSTHVVGTGLVHSFGNNRVLPARACALDPMVIPSNLTVGVPVSPIVMGSTGVLGDVRYEVVAGPLGLAVDGGVFGGSAQQTGVFSFTVQLTDGLGCTANQSVMLTSSCPTVMVSPTTVATLTTGVAMTPVQFTLAGSTAPSVDTMLSGALPIGVSFADGGLSGMPTLDGTWPVTLAAMDTYGCTAMSQLMLTVVRSANFQPTTLALSTPLNPAVFSAPTTFTATVGFAADAGEPTGTVTFQEAGAVLGSAPVQGGIAVFTTGALALGSHALTATYSGDTTFGASFAPAFSLEVVPATTVTTLTAFGTRLEVEVTSALAVPTGDVAFTVDGATAGTVTLDATGRARFAGPMTVGTHRASGRYLGAMRFAPSDSMEITFTVEPPMVDAGPEPMADAGMEPTPMPTGCGCTSVDFAPLLLALALFLRRR